MFSYITSILLAVSRRLGTVAVYGTRMASFSVRSGLTATPRAPHHSLIIVGQNKHVKNISFDTLSAKLEGHIDEAGWTEALARLPPAGSLPFYLNQAKVISISDTASRHNSPANPHAVTKEVRAAGVVGKETTSLSIVIVTEYAHALANVAAVARCFPLYSRKTTPPTLKEVIVEVVCIDKDVCAEDVAALDSVAASVRTTARLIDTPANELTTDAFVDEALAVAKHLGAGILTTVIKGEELATRGFGGIYHVGKAALQPPAFVVLTHQPEGATSTYALVGKGIVYDTGGMQIKGKTGMPSMKMDMGGAAALLTSFATLVASGFKQNLHVCLCIAENNISPVANKPDDIITLLSGKTVEINNTDAEGRLVLSDGVFYAKETLKADVIVDMATLTGAQAHMTGKHHAAVLTNCELFEEKIVRAGRFSGDLIHPMVFAPDLHFPDLNSSVADMKNSNLGKMMGPPSAIAGHFIGSNIAFGEGLRWAHIDMACCAMDGERALGYGVALVSAMLGEHTNAPVLTEAK
ncbi:lap-1 [Pristionchus pacificus]|uniref:Lap-1 n=1 Tax=Pristionchus pacificus TaxID=54126 RepID=A0A2A6B4V3_PRIPA|nr:lap-1 [Pristionchus pacificus]|eukprot:PDM60907.1 lap-1 [Pristionchus pacificus]